MASVSRVQQWVDRMKGARTQRVAIQVYLGLEKLPDSLQEQILDAADSQGISPIFWTVIGQDEEL